MTENIRKILNKLYTVVDDNSQLNSQQAKEIFLALSRDGVREVYCIIIPYPGLAPYRTYVKFCFREDLGCRGVERGLFNLYGVVGRLNVRMINQDLDWKTILWHLPCARDLVWNMDFS